MHHLSTQKSGFIALVSILLIATIVFVIAIGMSTRSLGMNDMSFAEESSYRALVFAESCAEHALYNLELDPNYTGGESMWIGTEACQLGSISSSASSTVVFSADATVAHFIRHITVEAIALSGSTTIARWGIVER